MIWTVENEKEYEYTNKIRKILVEQINFLKLCIIDTEKQLDKIKTELKTKDGELTNIVIFMSKLEIQKTGSLLPDDIYVYIFKFLSNKDLSNIYYVCISWNNIIRVYFDSLLKNYVCKNCKKKYIELYNTPKSCRVNHICGEPISKHCSRRQPCHELGCSNKYPCYGRYIYPCERRSDVPICKLYFPHHY
jgi:hypothetical protein